MGQWHGETTFPLPSNWLDRLPRWIKYHKERDSPIQRKEMHIKGLFLMHICYPYPKSRSSSCNCIHHKCPLAKILTVFLRKIVIMSFEKQNNTSFGIGKLQEFLTDLQVNDYEIVVNILHISHNLTWYSAIVQKFTIIYPVCSTFELTKQFMKICVKN